MLEADRGDRLRARHAAAPRARRSGDGGSDRARARAGSRVAAPLRGPIERLFPNLPHGPRTVIDWVSTIAGAVLIVLAVKAWVVNPYRIPSPSMEPTLHCARPAPDCEAGSSDRVLANRFIYRFHSPRRRDIVVFHAPDAARRECIGGTFVKRIIGLPGETWSERAGVTYINGRRLPEPYIAPARWDTETKTLLDIPPLGKLRRIPPRMYLVEGDNRAHSCDSRVWGLVPRANIIGKVFLTYWPLSRVGTP
ncbi:MAG: signal peptidase I [Actinobacteria bacterium]|nr:MAG: signal peptidase I [Actinomycetota bacterium]